jgi:hypothetical protein
LPNNTNFPSLAGKLLALFALWPLDHQDKRPGVKILSGALPPPSSTKVIGPTNSEAQGDALNFALAHPYIELSPQHDFTLSECS